MKNLRPLLFLLTLAGAQALQAASTQDVALAVAETIRNSSHSEGQPYWAWVEQVANLMQQGAVTDGVKLRKDTTITIYGSGGMDNESGKICPNTASSACAKIIIYGLAVIDGHGTLGGPVRGSLTDSNSKEYNVLLLSLTGAAEVDDASYRAEGKDAVLEVQ